MRGLRPSFPVLISTRMFRLLIRRAASPRRRTLNRHLDRLSPSKQRELDSLVEIIKESCLTDRVEVLCQIVSDTSEQRPKPLREAPSPSSE